eukprot:234277-Karenia_brevis.AAC.1
MKSASICLRLQKPSGAFWLGVSPECDSTDIIDVTFVDDEAVVLMASSAAKLDKAISILLQLLSITFADLDFKINWDKGKTECCLLYRGAGAGKAMANWQHHDGWYIPFADAGGSAAKLFIVSSYKHLGTVVAIDGSDVLDAKRKACSTMTAYAPIAVKIFGSSWIHMYLKLAFLDSLILTRLLLNVQIRVPSVRFVSIVSAVYMRVLRRIAGLMRYDGTACSDRQVRARLNQPSVDCLITRRRLMYLKRLVGLTPGPLHALLAVGCPTKPLPWVKLILSDLRLLRSQVSDVANMPNPEDNPEKWLSVILDERWRNWVLQLFFIDSVADKGEKPVVVKMWACEMCPKSEIAFFASERALRSHQ